MNIKEKNKVARTIKSQSDKMSVVSCKAVGPRNDPADPRNWA